MASPVSRITGFRCEKLFDVLMLSLVGAQHARVRTVRRGQPVYMASDPAEAVYYVKKGSVKLVCYSSAGDEVILDRYYTGALLGNLHFDSLWCLGEGAERQAAVALDSSEVIVAALESLKQNIRRDPETAFALLEDYSRRLAMARIRIESFVLYQAEERLARMLLLLTAQQNGCRGPAMLNAAITHEELAQWIGVTRPFVTRLMSQLRGRGFIEPLAAGRVLVHPGRIAAAYSISTFP